MKKEQEVLAEIDSTLDQLIANAQAANRLRPGTLAVEEICALQKTQESLLAHLLDKQRLLEKESKALCRISDKFTQYAQLNQQLMQQIGANWKGKASPISRRKHRASLRQKATN